MKITIDGVKSEQQVKDLFKLLKNVQDIELEVNGEKQKDENDEIERAKQYAKLATYIHMIIDLMCNRRPQLKESYCENPLYHELKDRRVNWELVDWIKAFPKDEKRIDFLLYKDTFLYIVGVLTREYMRCDGVPKECICCVTDISKDDYSIDESIELLKKFKSIV